MKPFVTKPLLTVCAIIMMFVTFHHVDTAHAGADPFIGEMSYVAFPWAPSGWTACDGQLLAISQYNALYACLGTNFGGNGISTFGLPDMRGRVPIHKGQSPTLSYDYQMGHKGGLETITLGIQHLPAHNHTASATSTSTSITSASGGVVNGTLKGSSNFGTTDDPSGNTLAKPYWGSSLSKTPVKAYTSDTPSVTMSAGSVSLDLSGVSLGNVTTTTNTTVQVDTAGLGFAFPIMQPYTVVNCIIALEGIFPARQ
ncbi:MAG: tail fiber protein [Desulfobacterales bacterium]|nr:tail fiber protein [Desulfobacterales bacterium]